MTLLHCILSGSIENFSLGKMTSLLTNLQVAMLLVEIATDSSKEINTKSTHWDYYVYTILGSISVNIYTLTYLGTKPMSNTEL